MCGGRTTARVVTGPARHLHIYALCVPRCVDEAACPLATLAVVPPRTRLRRFPFAPMGFACVRECEHTIGQGQALPLQSGLVVANFSMCIEPLYELYTMVIYHTLVHLYVLVKMFTHIE